jgi:hypothetical protein
MVVSKLVFDLSQKKKKEKEKQLELAGEEK